MHGKRGKTLKRSVLGRERMYRIPEKEAEFNTFDMVSGGGLLLSLCNFFELPYWELAAIGCALSPILQQLVGPLTVAEPDVVSKL